MTGDRRKVVLIYHLVLCHVGYKQSNQ